MSKKSKKGGAFEREIAKTLSRWWSNGESDAIFWRTANSGGRATVRGKVGKATKGQDGDLCATDPIGQVFIDHFYLELKNGYADYPYSALSDLIEAPESKTPLVHKWLQIAEDNRKKAGVSYWLLIRRWGRSRRVVLVAPIKFWNSLNATLTNCIPRMTTPSIPSVGVVVACPFDEFLKNVPADEIRRVIKRNT